MDQTLSTMTARLRCNKFRSEADLVAELVNTPLDVSLDAIAAGAADLVERARACARERSMMERFQSEFSLSSSEGLALMRLAESLLRTNDVETADALLADQLGAADWHEPGWSGDISIEAVRQALAICQGVTSGDHAFLAKLGRPCVRSAIRVVMGLLAREFVLGRTVEEALSRSEPGQLYSYDMLGEGARTTPAALNYLDGYLRTVEVLGDKGRSGASVSVKLSALHPRFEYSQRRRVLAELLPRMKEICLAAFDRSIEVTLDAEEADRLGLTLEILERLAVDPDIRSRGVPGIVVQAYSRRARDVIEWLSILGRQTQYPIPVRLVKGAYWDAEIKNAQIHGYADYPVFTRKAATDLSFLVCARDLLNHKGVIRPQIATHNAFSIAAIVEMAEGRSDVELQKLHGMGDSVYKAADHLVPDLPSVRTYAPVGGHRDLLAYLVRRLLENGANSSFVNRLFAEDASVDELVTDPVRLGHRLVQRKEVPHPQIPKPVELDPARQMAPGTDFSDGAEVARIRRNLVSFPVDGHENTTPEKVDDAVSVAAARQADWDALGASERADRLDGIATGLLSHRDELVSLLCLEAGKTVVDAVNEVREAVDFCRYYAVEARKHFSAPLVMPGPAGEENRLSLHGRGVFVCISPWNFPLAIFTGQVAAALVAGNAVVAKPAPDTPETAVFATRLMYEAGIPTDILHLVQGGADVGDQLVSHPLVAGVAFTGSTRTARIINRRMADADRPIAPLIAETGGQNAMIVDSSALLEQVTDDVITSAFSSSGQRCSAVRILYLQEEIADAAIELICGAMDELKVGDQRKLSTDVGPVISDAAAKELNAHVSAYARQGRLLHQLSVPEGGCFVPPALLEVQSMEELSQEHFGPCLHVARFKAGEFEEVVRQITCSGYGLTVGLHSRVDSRAEYVARHAGAGNVYINRSMIGAVPGQQPFGGRGDSGTGPKAGGPNYLQRFATERTVTTNTAAVGGTAELLNL